ncbi:MAG: 4'-phosphopantetheinyl transferase superfamily protein [Methylococcaceae bacterium]|nr:4'-phosphopantetheinyl transferase superfamily protein [Methylococcaceae bacterium]MDD1607829.1 4'-phosphopantetheinyl transferase superfamily protein [Methylococcaceae bacterium]MDD1610126.1 4'-phosphopantetheinyl transferase superfamily protein [Methylococcaceae bacterium]MDD1615253.1 4'-phosphopantetheinyl transferase superfamily protein [Methylococcaceae bacterium]OYV20848.1 MAG: 4'-phosphopantetheinyl transferase [Methylococcaceae bacterium NSP1-2]
MNIDFWYSQHLDNNPTTHHWNVLDSHEKNQAEKFKNSLLQQRYIAAHGFLRNILSQYLSVSPDSIRIQKTAQGKPYLVDYPELAFNLSHTGNHTAVAVAKNCQLGVDIEQCKHRTNLADLVRKCFSVEEATYWQQLPEAEQTREFYQFWTRKEAFVKATGFGIAVGLRDCAINPDNPHTFSAVPTVCGAAHTWHSRDIALGEGMCAALVTDKAISNVSVRE